MNRLGQGGFRQALLGVWLNTVAHSRPDEEFQLFQTHFGKPSVETFAFAERKLKAHRRALLGEGDREPEIKLKREYMIGDNPESDICGANNYVNSGTDWDSILVKTGVYRSGTPEHEPKAIVTDIKAAVQWALKKSGWETPFP